MNSFDILIEILEKSVEKNGAIPLTNLHLLNIIRMLRDREEREAIIDDIGASIFEIGGC